MNENIVQRLALAAARAGFRTKAQLAESLGVGRTTLYYVESNPDTASEQFIQALEELERRISEHPVHPASSVILPGDTAQFGNRTRLIPVLGYAHAGEAMNYEEIPEGWRDWIPTECRDLRAFGAKVDGESMTSTKGGLSFEHGDVIIIMPNERPRNGCFVMSRFVDECVSFRKYERSGDTITLIPLNERFPVTSHRPEDFRFIFPVWGRWTQLWNGNI